MPYLIITLGVCGQRHTEVLAFRSASVTASAFESARPGQDGVITLSSDLGEELTIRRDAVVDWRVQDDAPPTVQGGASPADIESLVQQLGRPLYDGPNGFSYSVQREPVTLALQFPDERTLLWQCRPYPELEMCMAQHSASAGWRYQPCALHRSQPVDLQ